MKAIQLKQPGGPKQIYVAECEIPKVQAGELLIEVRATAVNRADTLQRKGAYPPPPGASTIMGLEAAGVVVEVGEGCSGSFKVGDRVMALLAGGGYAEFVTAPEGCVLPIPSGFTFEQAAAVPETWLTAFQLLYTIGKVKQGDVVLVHAGASGVGTAAIQLARLAGATVLATAGSQEKIEYCESMGATKGFNYKAGPFGDAVSSYLQDELKLPGVDLILDCVGASYALMNFQVAAMDARWVLFGLMGGASIDQFPLGLILGKRVQLTGTTLRARSVAYKSELVASFKQVAFDKLRPEGPAVDGLVATIAKVYPLSEMEQAHVYMESNLNMGKIVVTVKSAL